jgi:hypothetical protein
MSVPSLYDGYNGTLHKEGYGKFILLRMFPEPPKPRTAIPTPQAPAINSTNTYSTNISNGSNPNCALSFKMQGAVTAAACSFSAENWQGLQAF